MATDVLVPTLGESITEATLGQWLKQPGDAVKADEPIASLETDKVAVEVPSPIDGVMGEQLVAVGDTVQVGAPIARIEAGGGAAAAPAAPASRKAPPVPRRSPRLRPRQRLPSIPPVRERARASPRTCMRPCPAKARTAAATPTSPSHPPSAASCWSTGWIRRRSKAPARTAA